MPEIGDKRYNTMNDINITLNGVTQLLKDLNPNKASGPDELTHRILKGALSDKIVNFCYP